MLSLVLADVRSVEARSLVDLTFKGKPFYDDRVAERLACQQLARSLVNFLLKTDFETSPEAYTLVKKESGAPYLKKADNGASVFSVSLSHSGPYVAVAVSNEGPMGVDIEDGCRHRALDKLQKRFSFSEQGLIQQEGLSGFYRLWTGREALAKSVGQGLDVALSLALAAWPTGNETWQGVEVFFKKKPLLPSPFHLYFTHEKNIFLSCARPGRDESPQAFSLRRYL